MFTAPLALAAALSLVAAPAIEPGTQLTYTGTMTGVKDDGNPAVKKFTLTLLAVGSAGETVDFAWTLAEKGRGSWTWLDRFGQGTADDRGPALLYEREEGKSVVPLPEPLFAAAAKLASDAAWTEGRMDYRVTGETQPPRAGAESRAAGERPCWEIDIRGPYGHKRTLWVAQDSPLVVAVNETVFIGQGHEHKLQLELTETKLLTADETAKAAAALQAWLALRESLAWVPRGKRDELSAQQLAQLKTALPKMAASAAVGPLSEIAAAAQRDATGQKNRAGALAALKDAIVGQPLGEIKLNDLSGKTVTSEPWKGKVVVLHFWQYRDTPLEEPYGQVGYLDFLLRRRGEAGLLLLGVNVVEQSDDEQLLRAAGASARKLKAFMNLSYPILQDDGSLLKRVGDPRVAGGKLPLFVVLGKDGKVAEYHAGLYDVKTNEGLAELDAVVEKLLK